MELKFVKSDKSRYILLVKSHLYGIEIAVNVLGVVFMLRLNRTFMELKYHIRVEQNQRKKV